MKFKGLDFYSTCIFFWVILRHATQPCSEKGKPPAGPSRTRAVRCRHRGAHNCATSVSRQLSSWIARKTVGWPDVSYWQGILNNPAVLIRIYNACLLRVSVLNRRCYCSTSSSECQTIATLIHTQNRVRDEFVFLVTAYIIGIGILSHMCLCNIIYTRVTGVQSSHRVQPLQKKPCSTRTFVLRGVLLLNRWQFNITPCCKTHTYIPTYFEVRRGRTRSSLKRIS